MPAEIVAGTSPKTEFPYLSFPSSTTGAGFRKSFLGEQGEL